MTDVYSNENIARQLVDALRAYGHDVLTSHEAGRANAAVPDEEVLRFAAETGRVVLTYNRRDFARLHRSAVDHPGIIGCTLDADHAALARRIHEALSGHNPLTGTMVHVTRDGYRVETKAGG